MLDIYADGSGRLQFGAGPEDGWRFKAGTIDVARATKDLRALPNVDKGQFGSLSTFVYNFESERLTPDKPGKARFTQDGTVIPGLLKAAADAAQNPSEHHARRRAEIQRMFPLPAKQ